MKGSEKEAGVGRERLALYSEAPAGNNLMTHARDSEAAALLKSKAQSALPSPAAGRQCA